MTRPRLIASDLDGTLLDPRGEVSPRTRAALDRARAAGVIVVPATGRPPSICDRVFAAAGFDSWALCSNGAITLDLGADVVHDTAGIDHELMRSVIAEIRRTHPEFGFTLELVSTDIHEHGFSEKVMVPPTSDPVADILETPWPEATLKLLVFHRDHPASTILELIEPIIRPDLHGTWSSSHFLDVMAAGVDKASGLANLCRHLGIDRSEVVALGDNENDRSMLAWAGTGIVMGGAPDDLVAVADDRTAGNDDDGAARAIESLLA